MPDVRSVLVRLSRVIRGLRPRRRGQRPYLIRRGCDRHHGPGIDPADEAFEDLVGSQLHVPRGAERTQPLDALGPVDRAGELARQQAASARLPASSTAADSPEITTWPGALELARNTLPTWRRTLRHSSPTVLSGSPRITCITPAPAVAWASSARRTTRSSPCSKVMPPAASTAAYSPSECPATRSGRKPSALASRKQAAEWV